MAVLLAADKKHLGEFSVARILPNQQKKMVGPFIFYDHIGPAEFDAGSGINVRPHPHIGLATITYLFDGSILHRDSLGNVLEIMPGDVNWMTAGSGIVHSERESIEVRSRPHSLHGIQCWLALPAEVAAIDAAFSHIKKHALPHIIRKGVSMRLIAGEAYQRSSPVKTYSAMFYLDVLAEKGEKVERPFADYETAIHLISGEITIGEARFQAGDFILMDAGEQSIEVSRAARFLLLGGEKFVETPHLYWNFVAFDKAEIEQAKVRWQNGGFPPIAGDDEEHIPLPE